MQVINTIMVTGAGGYVGRELLRQLLEKTNCEIYALSSDTAAIMTNLHSSGAAERIRAFDRGSPDITGIPWEKVDILIHLAFARKQFPQSELVESMSFSKKIFQLARDAKIPALINVSSQSVYGSAPGLHREDSQPCPLDYYALAKCANEIILDAVFSGYHNTRTTNIRLDSIAGNKNLLPTLVRQGIEDKQLKLMGGQQVFSLLDVRDAASGLIALCATDTAKWRSAYNLGWNNRIYSLPEIAELVCGRLEKYGVKGIQVSLEEKDIKTYAGMDSTAFIQDTGWTPCYDITDIIDSVIADYYAGKKTSQRI